MSESAGYGGGASRPEQERPLAEIEGRAKPKRPRQRSFTARDVATSLGVSRTTFWRWRRDPNSPPGQRLPGEGPQLRWLTADLDSWQLYGETRRTEPGRVARPRAAIRRAPRWLVAGKNEAERRSLNALWHRLAARGVNLRAVARELKTRAASLRREAIPPTRRPSQHLRNQLARAHDTLDRLANLYDVCPQAIAGALSFIEAEFRRAPRPVKPPRGRPATPLKRETLAVLHALGVSRRAGNCLLAAVLALSSGRAAHKTDSAV